MSATPTTCPHCGAEKSEESDADIQVFECGTEIIESKWQSIPSDCYDRQIAAMKAELEQAKADRARAAMEERNKCLATMERQKVALQQLFYARTPLGEKVEDLIFEWDQDLHRRVMVALEAQP